MKVAVSGVGCVCVCVTLTLPHRCSSGNITLARCAPTVAQHTCWCRCLCAAGMVTPTLVAVLYVNHSHASMHCLIGLGALTAMVNLWVVVAKEGEGGFYLAK